MKEIQFRPAPSRLLAGLFCLVALVVSGGLWLHSGPAAPGDRTGEPASEGLPITPAGAWVMDASTQLPAVVPDLRVLARQLIVGGEDTGRAVRVGLAADHERLRPKRQELSRRGARIYT